MWARVHGYLIPVGVVLRDNVSFNIVSPENITNLKFDEDNPLPNPPLHIDPDAWETEHRVVEIPVATTESGGDDMEAVAEDEYMEEEQDDGFIEYDDNEEEEDSEESEADTSYDPSLDTNLFD